MHRNGLRILFTLAAILLVTVVAALALTAGALPLESLAAVLAVLAVSWLVASTVWRRFEPAAVEEQRASRPAATPRVVRSAPAAPRELDDSLIPEDVSAEIRQSALAEDAPRPVQPTPASAPEASGDHSEIAAALSDISVQPPDVVATAVACLDRIGSPISVGLWLEDPSTATLRAVFCTGEMPASGSPIPVGEEIVAQAMDSDAPAHGLLADITSPEATRRIARFVTPISAPDGRGAFIADIGLDEERDVEDIAACVAGVAPLFAPSLELHVARHEAAVARELTEAARELSRTIDPRSVLETSLARAVALAEAETASIMLSGEDGALSIEVSVGLPEQVVEATTVRPGEGIAGWVFTTAKPLLVEDLPAGGGRSGSRGVRSAVCAPIADEAGVLGVLNVGSRAYPARFTQAHLDAMEALGRQTCVAYRNALALGSARDLYLDALRTLAVAMETKDPYSRGSTRRVLDGVAAVADALGLPDEKKTSVEIAALFHDIGMAAVGEGVTSDARPLTTVEHGLLKMHPVVAAEVLAEAPALQEVASIVYHHHERFDGKGYVGGLAGEAIPLGARILSVVDAYDAMTTPRPYRDARSQEEAIEELRSNAGTQFDPVVVERFVALLEGDGIPVRERQGN